VKKLNKQQIRAGSSKHNSQPPPFTKSQLQEWNKATKFPEYFVRSTELSKTGVWQERIHFQAIEHIHRLMEEEEWFAENTPYPFKAIHWSRIASLASLCCRYLQKLAFYDNEDAVKTLARITVEMTETLTELLTSKSESAKNNEELIQGLNSRRVCDDRKIASSAELMQSIADELPYWPMLRFLNTAANSKKQFQRIAKDLKLGKDCPINVSESANYSLETQINSFVWKCLRHFQKVHWYIRIGFEGPGYGHVDGPAKTFEEAVEGIILTKLEPPAARRPITVGMIKREDIHIYKVSYKLPPLTKNNAKEWADKALIPYIESSHSDWKIVEALAHYTGKAGGRAKAKEKIFAALKGLAKPSLS
jgi:hypothetical protein